MCCKGCNNCNYSNKNISFHNFPLDPILKANWIEATGVGKGYICSVHFEKKMYLVSEVERERLRLKKIAVPTLFIDTNFNKSSSLMTQTQHLDDAVNKIENISIRNGVTSPHLLAMAKSLRTSNDKTSINTTSSSELCAPRKSLFPSSTIKYDFSQIIEPYNIDEIQLTPRTKQLRKSLCGLPKKGRPTIVKINTQETKLKKLKAKLKKIENVNQQLRNDNQKVQEEKKKLENELIEVQHKSDLRVKSIASVLSNFFSPGQVKAIHMGPDWKKKIRWSSEDISSAISLQSVSPKAYRYLSKKFNFPLPSISTLCRRTQVMTLRPGFIDDVFSVMKGKSENMTDLDKITIISYDEMYLHNRIEYEPQEQRILGPHNNVQVMCARGLFSQWKQPIFFDFDCDMSVTILNTAINKLNDVGFLVVAFVSDMGPKNRCLHKKFDITPAKPYFDHPSISGGKVFCFTDTPHLLNLIRNHLLDNDLTLADGQIINRKPLDKLVEIQTTQLKPGWNLSKTLLDVKGSERQNVKAAARVLSSNTAKAILFVGDNNLFNGSGAENCYKITSQFIQMVNDWFDIHNSNNQFGPHPAFGKDPEKQINILNKMSSTIENLRVKKHCSMLPFQHGILINNASLIQLLPHLQNRFSGISYILTRRLNQDILENLFSYLRAMGHSFDHPGPLEFIYRLKKYILGKHSSAVFSLHKNAEDDIMTNNLSYELLENKNISNTNNEIETDIILTQSIFDAILDGNDLIFDEDEFDFETKNMDENINNNIISMTGLEYITGFVAHHFRAKHPNLISNGDMNNSSWIAYASRGNLTVPDNKLMDVAKVRSHCAYPCQCTNRDPVCEPGVPHTRDGCGCCPVCARQDGDPCDGIAVCDQRKGLVCQYDDYYSAAGICRVVKGLPCTVYNKTYDNGETFRLDCRTQCTCQNGTYACASLCPQENISPQGLCRHPRLVEVPGQCCREWMCDNVNMEKPPNCEALVTPWAECSSRCGLGLSRRMSNANEACKPNNETRLCQIRPCHSPPLVNAKYARHHHIRKGHECKATIKSTTPVRLKFGDCRSRKTFHPKRCGAACPSSGSGIVCAPELSTTVKVEFLCRSPVEGHDRLDGAVPGDDLWEPVHRPFSATADDYVHSVYVDVEWIVKCTCRRSTD